MARLILLTLVFWRTIGQGNVKYMKNFLHTFIIVSIIAFVFPMQSFAMSIFFETSRPMYGIGQEFIVDVNLDTETNVVNTISGEIIIPSQNLQFIDIIDGGSSVLFWIDRPKYNPDTSSIVFSGITPGGISGESIELFSIQLKTLQESQSKLEVKNIAILLHDGQGTQLSASFVPRTIFVSKDVSILDEEVFPGDKEAPEDFTPSIVQDPNLFNGKFVLVFATQDKLSGISHYEVKEGFFNGYSIAESPYILKKQNLSRLLYVKAIDKFGNERIAIVHPQKKIFNEVFFLISCILIVGVISFLYFKKR